MKQGFCLLLLFCLLLSSCQKFWPAKEGRSEPPKAQPYPLQNGEWEGKADLIDPGFFVRDQG